MTVSSRRTHGVQHGPRSAQVIEGVRAATLQELSRAGFDGVTVDGVARAAGVNRTTIYRRWPTKAALLGAVIEPLLADYDCDPDTGSLEGDLRAIMARLAHNTTTVEGRAIADAMRSGAPELRALTDDISTRAVGPFRRAFGLAVARGDLPADTDVEMLVHVTFHGLITWKRAYGTSAGDAECERLLRVVLAGADVR